MIQSVLVLGGGSAGFLAAATLKHRLPALQVTVLRSPDIGIIGVGEATTLAVPRHLHNYLAIDHAEFHRLAEPTWKVGIRFLWGPRPFFDYGFGLQMDTRYAPLPKATGYFCEDVAWDHIGFPSALMSENKVFLRQPSGLPLMNGDVAYHIENEKFVGFLETFSRRLGVEVREDTMVEVFQDDTGITGLKLKSGQTASADLFIDCSGFASVLLGRTLGEGFISFKPSLYCDRAVIGGWDRAEEPIKPYTTAETMNGGWCWQIDHEHRINRGYVYSSSFLSDDDAETEFRAKNPKISDTRIVKYVSGRYHRSWVKNVVAIGNSSGFVEPLESTGLGAICGASEALAETLADSERSPTPTMQGQFNKRHGLSWDSIRRFLSIHYRFNTRLDTPFWQECREHADLAGAEEIVDYYRENGPSLIWRHTLVEPGFQFPMEGWISLLVGQKVPFERRHKPTADELHLWEKLQQHFRQESRRGFSTVEMLKLIRSPYWNWPTQIYPKGP